MRRWLPVRRRRSDPADDGLPLRPIARADRFGFGDLFTEATTDIGSRPARLVMTLAGTVLGTAALVATIDPSQTSAAQISRKFDAAAATQLVVSPAEAQTRDGGAVAAGTLPWDAVDRVTTLAGVESAALVTEVNTAGMTITSVPVNDPSAAAAAPPPLVAASAGLIDTVGGSIVTGRGFDVGHDARGDRVALVGSRAAEQLGVMRVDTQPSIFIDGLAYAVIGVFADVQQRGELLNAVVVPTGAARADFAVAAPEELQARIVVGAGPQLQRQAPIALVPDAPESLDVSAPAGRSELGQSVQSDITVVFVILGVIVLLAGGLGIANVTTLSVMERVGEIGLRRALGSTRRQIAAQFVLESIVIGLLGGLLGAAVGVFAILVVSAVQGWAPVADPLVAIGGVILGAVVGLLAGGIPARRASRIEPITALRASAT